MQIRIIACSNDETVRFAASEAARYLRALDPRIVCDIMTAAQQENALNLTVSPALLAPGQDAALDDAIEIDVCRGTGAIKGSNPRSVLLGVYRYLRELGYIFAFPGPDGEIAPTENRLGAHVRLREAAAYRHRGICDEGAISYQHIADTIDWLPKVGMNSYFNQGRIPYGFMKKWYAHEGSSTLPPEPFTPADAEAMMLSYQQEIKKRGLLYHAVGHNWQNDAYGVDVSAWRRGVDQPTGEYAEVISMLNGKRQLFGWSPETTSPSDTHLCYSMEKVRERITDVIADYCEAHAEVDYLHFWLADAINNHCECPECRKKRPSDWYVMMLNLLDEKLTRRGLKNKIVFLIYVDLLWAPETETLHNPERFVLMFAPITRTFSRSFSLPQGIDPAKVPLPPYVRNQLPMPRSVEENAAHLLSWSRAFCGDSFDYDYHGVGAHLVDAGGVALSRVLHQDIRALRDLGLHGLISCQVLRAYYPTGLMMHVMAETLWNRDADFDALCDRFFLGAYGKDGLLLKDYLTQLGRCFDMAFFRGERKEEDPAPYLAKLADVEPLCDAFAPVIGRNIAASEGCRRRLWQVLGHHAYITVTLARIRRTAAADRPQAEALAAALCRYIDRTEPELHPFLDAGFMKNKARQYAK